MSGGTEQLALENDPQQNGMTWPLGVAVAGASVWNPAKLLFVCFLFL